MHIRLQSMEKLSVFCIMCEEKMSDGGEKVYKTYFRWMAFFHTMEQSFLVETAEQCHFIIVGVYIRIHVMLYNETFKKHEKIVTHNNCHLDIETIRPFSPITSAEWSAFKT